MSGCGHDDCQRISSYPTSCLHPTMLSYIPLISEPLVAIAQPDYTDLLLLIAECLVVLAFKAEPDAGRRQSRLYALAAAKDVTP